MAGYTVAVQVHVVGMTYRPKKRKVGLSIQNSHRP